MKTTNQQIASANALALVRGAEAQLQLLTGVDRSLEQALYRASQAPIGTQPRRRKPRDRAASKRQARWIGLVRFYRPETFHTGNYQLGI